MRPAAPELQRRHAAGAIVLLLCAVAAGSAAGADLGGGGPAVEQAAPLPMTAGWSLKVTPYAWLPFLTGDVTVRRRTVDIDVNPIEVLDHLTHEGGHIPAWMSYVEARRGPIALYNDTFYANLGLSGDLARTRPGRADLGISAGLDLEQEVVELGATYELARWMSSSSSGLKDWAGPAPATALDILAGARYWHQEVDLSLALTAALDTSDLDVRGNRALARSGGVDWLDPLVGLRLRHQFAAGHELVLRGDVGGFGAGSQLSWQVVAGYGWELAARDGLTWSGLLGYRALDVDYRQGSGRRRYQYDVLQHGPLLGLTVGF